MIKLLRNAIGLLGKTSRTKKSECPQCGCTLDAATPMKGGGKPKKDDLTMCYKCGTILCFKEDLSTRKATDTDLMDIEPEDMQTLNKVQKMIRGILFIVCILLLSCAPPETKRSYPSHEPDAYVNIKMFEVAVVRVKDCEYVFWERGYGSDMEHYAGLHQSCTPIQSNKLITKSTHQ